MASLAALDDAPALFRCDIPDYETPALSLCDNDADDDVSLESAYNAYVAAAVPPTPMDHEPFDEMMFPYVASHWSYCWSHLKEYHGQDL